MTVAELEKRAERIATLFFRRGDPVGKQLLDIIARELFWLNWEKDWRNELRRETAHFPVAGGPSDP